MKFKWTRQLVEHLLDAYEEHEALYNVRHPDYIKRDCREKSLEKICKKLKLLNSSITIHEVRNKIQILRGQYMKELRYMATLEKRNDLLSAESYEPKLWCFEKLNFLKNYCGLRGTSTVHNNEQMNISKGVITIKTEDPEDLLQQNFNSLSSSINYQPRQKENTITIATATTSNTSNNTTTTSTTNTAHQHNTSNSNKTKRKDYLTNKTEAKCEYFMEQVCKALNNQDDDGFDIFGKSVAHKLRSLPNDVRIQTEKIINDILYYAEKGTVTANTTFSLEEFY